MEPEITFTYARTTLDWVSLGFLIAVALILFYGIIAIHDIPYEISKKRNHPHQDAIHVAGWISLFTLHAIWPFLWIWATLYREDRGWGFARQKGMPPLDEQLQQLQAEVKQLREDLTRVQSLSSGTPPETASPAAPPATGGTA